MKQFEMDALKALAASFDLDDATDVEIGGANVGACNMCCNNSVGGGGKYGGA